MKGTNAFTKAQEAIVKKIGKAWLCPWCFTVPFVKPAKHPSTANDETLLERTLSCTVIQNLLDEVKKSSENSSLPIDVSGIENRLDLLSKEIKEFKDSSRDSSASKARTPFASSNTPIHEEVVMDCPEKPYETISQNFLASEVMDHVTDLFGYLRDNGDFIMERGHGVKLYGEPYSYTGSKSLKPEAITPEFENIIDQLSSELKLNEDERPNSILVNYYPASTRSDPADSFLAMHSDDESSIKAESKIITLSIGASRKIVFESKNQGEVKKVDLDATHNSVYVMSRQSQNWFRHGVPPPPDPNEVTEDRFSVTFRSLHKKFKRSMIILGDSNTTDINFGVGPGKVGQSYPGKRVKAAMVKDINAKDCTGYSNIFIMCGTNNLRCKYISSEQDIVQVVEKLQEKLVEIKQLCSGAKVFVIPVMPSRIPKMNLNISMYNQFVAEMLESNFPDIWFQGIYSFVDNKGLLHYRLTRENDQIHLSSRGIAKLVTYMKICVFTREKYENTYTSSPKQKSAPRVGSPEPA